MRSLLCLIALSVAAGAASSDQARIVGGTQTVIEQYPFSAVLLHLRSANNFRQLCGGSIINNRSVLGAAHCFEGLSNRYCPFFESRIGGRGAHEANCGFARASSGPCALYSDRAAVATWRIRVGSTNAHSGGALHNLNHIIVHPSYSRNTLDSDIVLIRSANAFAFNQRVLPGPIAGSNYNIRDNEAVWAIGWGATFYMGNQAEQLRHVQFRTINLEECRRRYAVVSRTVTANMLCTGWETGFRGQCHGDSGSPVLHGHVIVGVTSWGEMCAQPRFPSVNVRVPHFASWITSNA